MTGGGSTRQVRMRMGMDDVRNAGMLRHMKKASAPIRFHVENNPAASNIYHVTPELFRSAMQKRPALDGRIQGSFGCDPAQLERPLQEAEVLFMHGRLDMSDLATRAPRLRWIQSTGAGVDRLLRSVPSTVVVTGTSGIHVAKGGEYAMTALLMLNHRVPHFVTAQRKSRWDQSFSTPIAGKTVVILGAGAIGSEAARLARRFGMRIFGVSRSAKRNPAFDQMHGPNDLAEILPQADFLLVILPLTKETRGLLGRGVLDLLPPRAGVINLGRGAVIDNEALAAKLQKAELSGAVLDVYPEEPLPPSSPLWSTPNLIMSPHCAVDDGASYAESALNLFLDNLQRYVAGRKLTNVIDRNLGY
jgi:phosphoglycerate dehydrogenase-like enzyme